MMRLQLRLAALCLPALALAACSEAKQSAKTPFKVVAQRVAPQAYDSEVALTGSVRARVQTELSFRVSGRVIERRGEVGQHVEAGAVLARLDPSEQRADLDAAKAGVAGAEATLRQASAAFDRQKSLLASGYTTKASYDLADQARRTAAGSLDAAKAQLGAAQDAASYTDLRAARPGVIIARNIEVGQVAQAAQSAFGFAEDGPRDVVFAVYESIFSHRPASAETIDLSLLGDPNVTAKGKIREVSPVVDEKTGTVQVKVEIESDAAAMPLGGAVMGRAHWRLDDVVVLPWSAMATRDGKPAVWIVDPSSGAVSLRPVEVALFEKEKIVLRDGFHDGETIVIEGGKFLREGQIVSIMEGQPS
jgi:RND family efflux transporter MFP subunit